MRLTVTPLTLSFDIFNVFDIVTVYVMPTNSGFAASAFQFFGGLEFSGADQVSDAIMRPFLVRVIEAIPPLFGVGVRG